MKTSWVRVVFPLIAFLSAVSAPCEEFTIKYEFDTSEFQFTKDVDLPSEQRILDFDFPISKALRVNNAVPPTTDANPRRLPTELEWETWKNEKRWNDDESRSIRFTGGRTRTVPSYVAGFGSIQIDR